ncbi:MAG: FecR domain-containing protein [Leptospiraceae bacterium]|nr:FecR domain-containing protein [Leptospiraceae bacterium]
MKQLKSVYLFIIIFAVLFQCKGKNEEPNIFRARVSFIQGTITVTSENGMQKKISIGSSLEEKDKIETGKDSYLELLLVSGAKIRLKSQTNLVLQELSPDKKNTELKLLNGTLISTVNKKNKEESFKVETPTAVAGVRGTLFLIKVETKDGEIRTQLGVKEGQVVINGINKSLEEIVVQANEEVVEVQNQKFEKRSLNASLEREFSFAEEDDNTIKFYGEKSTEEMIRKKYKKLEVITLSDGTKLRGVISSMGEKEITIETPEGTAIIPREKLAKQEMAK